MQNNVQIILEGGALTFMFPNGVIPTEFSLQITDVHMVEIVAYDSYGVQMLTWASFCSHMSLINQFTPMIHNVYKIVIQSVTSVQITSTNLVQFYLYACEEGKNNFQNRFQTQGNICFELKDKPDHHTPQDQLDLQSPNHRVTLGPLGLLA